MQEKIPNSTEQVLAANERLIGIHNGLVDDLEAAEEFGYDAPEEESEGFSEGFSEALNADTGYGYAFEDPYMINQRLDKVRSQIDDLYRKSKDIIHVAALKENTERDANQK